MEQKESKNSTIFPTILMPFAFVKVVSQFFTIPKVEKAKEFSKKAVDEANYERAKEAAKEQFGDDLNIPPSIMKYINKDKNKQYRDQLIKKADAGNTVIEYTYYYLTNDDAYKIEYSMTKEDQHIVNAICEIFECELAYPDVEPANLKIYDPKYEDTSFDVSSSYLISIESIRKKLQDISFMDMVDRVDRKRREKKEIEDKHNQKIDYAYQKYLQKCKDQGYEVHGLIEDNNNYPVVEDNPINTNDDGVSIDISQNSPIWSSNGAIKPIYITPEGGVVDDDTETVFINKRPDGIDDKDYDKIEAVINPILKDTPYYYTLDGYFINLHIIRDNDLIDHFGIDRYSIGRGMICMICQVDDFNESTGKYDIIQVPIEYEYDDIIQKVLTIPEYKLSSKDCKRLSKAYFSNLNLYRYIDMSNTEIFAALDNKEYQKLGNILESIVMEFVVDKNTFNAPDNPRFRFESIESEDQFVLVSDNQVKILFDYTENSQIIIDGLVLEYDHGTITEKYRGYQLNYKFDGNNNTWIPV